MCQGQASTTSFQFSLEAQRRLIRIEQFKNRLLQATMCHGGAVQDCTCKYRRVSEKILSSPFSPTGFPPSQESIMGLLQESTYCLAGRLEKHSVEQCSWAPENACFSAWVGFTTPYFPIKITQMLL